METIFTYFILILPWETIYKSTFAWKSFFDDFRNISCQSRWFLGFHREF